jgi:transcriptional repressor NrdR
MVVVKKDNNREPYDRQKIEGGILRACHKRPVSVNQIKRVVDEIEKEIFDREEKEISSSEIGELVIKRVHSLDPVAYVRFASVYRHFKDINEFMEELSALLNNKN